MRDAGRIGFVIKGDYDSTARYEFLDVVYFNRNSYVAKKTTIGNEPEYDSDHWHILAEGSAEMEGATTEESGTSGLVPAPAAGENNAHLKGDGTWDTTSYLPVNKVTNSNVVAETGYAADATQLNATVEGSYAKGVAEDISKINADLANLILNGNTLSIPNISIPVCITGGGKDFIFSIPIGKYASYTKASIHGSVAVRQNGNYLIGSSAQNAEMTFTGNIYNGNLIHVHYTFSTSFDNVINNDVAIMVITGLEITFS